MSEQKYYVKLKNFTEQTIMGGVKRMKIRIQGNKIVKYIKAKNGYTYSESYLFTNHGVSNLMRRVAELGNFDFDDKESFDNFERISDLWTRGRLV